jgi:hypothetical protein
MSDESTPGVSASFSCGFCNKGLAPERDLATIQDKNIVANNDSTLNMIAHLIIYFPFLDDAIFH